MESDQLVELEAVRVKYYSPHDEQCFFDWLGRMECVRRFYGRGDTLYIVIDRALLSRREMHDLLGFFYRYNISMTQLRVLETPEFSRFLRDRDAYWNYRMFRSKDAAAWLIAVGAES
jgi:hypothetical protein